MTVSYDIIYENKINNAKHFTILISNGLTFSKLNYYFVFQKVTQVFKYLFLLNIDLHITPFLFMFHVAYLNMLRRGSIPGTQ